MDFIYLESDLQFIFASDQWQVQKYDTHPYFQGFSGVGLKGVDFVAIFQEKEIFLIEVKNYSLQGQTIRTKEVTISLSDPLKIARAVLQKFEDTLAGIKAIHTYYQRKAQGGRKWLKRWQKVDQEAIFWQQVCSLVVEQKALRLVLWLEYDQEDQKIADAIKADLLKQAKDFPGDFLVLHQNAHPFGDYLQVKQIKIN